MPRWDDRIDRAIDDVAGEMTMGDASGDLRTRVLARIDAGASRRIAWLGWIGIAAAAAAIVIAVVTRQQVRLKPDTTTAVPAPAPVVQPFRAAAPAAAQGPALRPAAAKRIAIPPSAVDALAPPPIDFAPLAVDDLGGGPDLDLQPLDPVAPIAIAPLGEGDRR